MQVRGRHRRTRSFAGARRSDHLREVADDAWLSFGATAVGRDGQGEVDLQRLPLLELVAHVLLRSEQGELVDQVGGNRGGGFLFLAGEVEVLNAIGRFLVTVNESPAAIAAESASGLSDQLRLSDQRDH